jgi:hypothetical protein
LQESLENKREELRGWKALQDNIFFKSYQLALLADKTRSEQLVFGGAPESMNLLVEREQQIGRVGAMQFALDLVERNINELQEEIRQHESQNSIPTE